MASESQMTPFRVLWTLRGDGGDVRCLMIRASSGYVVAVEGRGEWLECEILPDPDAAIESSLEWRAAFVERGWSEI